MQFCNRAKLPLKHGPNHASFCLFSCFSQHNDNFSAKFDYNYKKHRWSELGIRTHDHRMLDGDESTEL